MSGFLQSSIGQKLIMSLSGLFLIVFLLVHLAVNMLLVFDSSGELFNQGAHFMATNPMIKIVEPVLAIGFLVHIIYAAILTLQNQRARPGGYQKFDQSNSSKWASRNMFVLGGFVFGFLALHIANFYMKIKFGDPGIVTVDGVEMHNAHAVVVSYLSQWWYSALYVVWAVFLGLHLHHAFWSAFQTIGLSNQLWRTRLQTVSNIYAIVVAGGFAFIAIYMAI